MSAISNKPQFYDEYDLKVVDPNWLQERVKPKRHIGLEADLCILCRACEDVCPWDCIYMLSGEIVAVNAELGDNPERINEDPYGDGWMVRVKLSDPGEVDALLDVDAYRELLSSS